MILAPCSVHGARSTRLAVSVILTKQVGVSYRDGLSIQLGCPMSPCCHRLTASVWQYHVTIYHLVRTMRYTSCQSLCVHPLAATADTANSQSKTRGMLWATLVSDARASRSDVALCSRPLCLLCLFVLDPLDDHLCVRNRLQGHTHAEQRFGLDASVRALDVVGPYAEVLGPWDMESGAYLLTATER